MTGLNCITAIISFMILLGWGGNALALLHMLYNYQTTKGTPGPTPYLVKHLVLDLLLMFFALSIPWLYLGCVVFWERRSRP